MLGKCWPLLAAMVCGAAAAQTPPVPQPARPAPPQTAAREDSPDEDLLEFLGSDDVGDTDWWEFLKRAPARGNRPPPPPQDTDK